MGVSPRHRRHHYALAAMVALAGFMGGAGAGDAQVASVPVSLQVQLLSRVVQYERSFSARAAAGAVVLVVSKPGNAVSSRTAGQIADALRRLGRLGPVAIEVEELAFSTPAALGERVRTRSAALVYLSTGLTDSVAGIAGSLSGNTVLSVSAADADAAQGAVLTFELVEASPRLVVNLDQARRQRVTFSAGLLRLARVIQGSS